MAKSYTVKKLAELSGVTVKTLHHYDKLGLLVPKSRSEAGYRLYGQEELLRLQQILLWRHLGLALEKIRGILDDPNFDIRKSLEEQRRLVRKEAEEAQKKLLSIERAIQLLERGENMENAKSLFDGFDAGKYSDESAEHWGDTEIFQISKERTKSYTPKIWQEIKSEADGILVEFAALMEAGEQASSSKAMELAEQYRLHIDRWFYPCSKDMQVKLAEMYEGDERFAKNFDRYAMGLAEFVATAIRENAA